MHAERTIFCEYFASLRHASAISTRLCLAASLPTSAGFRISGNRTVLAAIIPRYGLQFTESILLRRQRLQNANESPTDTTYNLTVSDADGDSVPQQITEADSFLATNAKTLQAIIQAVPGCRFTIDFSWDFPSDSTNQYNEFPSAFLSRLVELDITLVVSVYGCTPTGLV